MPKSRQEELVALSARVSARHRRLIRLWAAANDMEIGQSMELAIENLIAAKPIALDGLKADLQAAA